MTWADAAEFVKTWGLLAFVAGTLVTLLIGIGQNRERAKKLDAIYDDVRGQDSIKERLSDIRARIDMLQGVHDAVVGDNGIKERLTHIEREMSELRAKNAADLHELKAQVKDIADATSATRDDLNFVRTKLVELASDLGEGDLLIDDDSGGTATES